MYGFPYLEHYGIKGMKWGIRRYQNADGTLTDAGRKRANKLRAKEIKKRSKKIRNKEDLAKMTSYIMSMPLRELELYNKSPYKRAQIERKAFNNAVKYANTGNEKKAKDFIDSVFIDHPSWDTVEGQQWYGEFLDDFIRK